MKKNIKLCAALILGAAALLGSCSGNNNNTTPETTPTVTESKLIASYVGTFEGGYYIPAYQMVTAGYDNYVVDLYDDNTYVSNRVSYMDMYGTSGSVVITTTGSYSTSENSDGDKIVSLSDAASILYTTCGMFNYQFSYGVQGIADSNFPVALMGSSSASDSLDFFKEEYGFGYSFLTTDTNCLIAEVYLPQSYASHFGKTSSVVNPYSGTVKAHDFCKNITNVYVGTFAGGYYIPAYSMLQAGYDNYVVTTYDDGTYCSIDVKYMDMYGTPGSVVIETEGKYSTSENADGDKVVSLAAADSILYTTCGMFNYQFCYGVDGMKDSTFPVALLGSSSASDSLEYFKEEYGYAYSFVTTDTGSLIGELNLTDKIKAELTPAA